MRFSDRTEAGELLAGKLKKYRNKDVVVYALPRGGVVIAVEVAKYIHAPLDLIITRKISHPHNPEYAIAATAENGHIVGNRRELMSIDEEWLEEEIGKEREEVIRRREKYFHRRNIISPENKIAILVDDGAATGLTLRAGIIELKHYNPKKLIVAVPVVPRSTARIFKKEADGVIALEIPPDDLFLSAVGAYYDNFTQITDEQVITILNAHEAWLKKGQSSRVFTVKHRKLTNDYVDHDES